MRAARTGEEKPSRRHLASLRFHPCACKQLRRSMSPFTLSCSCRVQLKLFHEALHRMHTFLHASIDPNYGTFSNPDTDSDYLKSFCYGAFSITRTHGTQDQRHFELTLSNDSTFSVPLPIKTTLPGNRSQQLIFFTYRNHSQTNEYTPSRIYQHYRKLGHLATFAEQINPIWNILDINYPIG